jgi:hypothetical protein
MPADPAPFSLWSYILGISGTLVGLVIASSSTNFRLSLGAVARPEGSEGMVNRIILSYSRSSKDSVGSKCEPGSSRAMPSEKNV